MTLAAGSRLGPYEILALLGAGGMGEVYRARDERLKREVAVKVLPAPFSSDSHRLKRFEQEAQAAGRLNHPNIAAIYDIGSHEGAPYIVSELLEGETLRARLSRGGLPSRKAVELATQVANGLAAAHEKGIVHRDLKPENLFLTKDGGVKILDFGLAKLTHPEEQSGSPTDERTATAVSGVGAVLGTLGYMAPEQVRGFPADRRSDIFSFGAVLYEMLVGVQAFRGVSRVEILSRILEEDPPELYKVDPRIPPGLMRIVGRCLEKEPRDRFESIKDVGFALNAYAGPSEESQVGSVATPPSRRLSWRVVFAATLLLAIIGATYWIGRRVQLSQTSSPRFRQLTFRGAGIGTARFAPDGQSVVFSAQTEGKPPELLSLRLDSLETRWLGLPPAQILSISSLGEMAILLLRPFALSPRIGHLGIEQLVYRDSFLFAGTLAEASLAGGAPRELLEDVMWADWAPGGKDLAVVHRVGNRNRLEFPIGKAIYDSEVELLNHPRISSREARVAFKDWGWILLKDPGGPARALRGPGTAYEAAWSDASGEIWYTVGAGGGLLGETQLRAITPRGHDRLVATLPADFILYDIAADGHVLLGRLVESIEILGSFPDEPRQRNLSHFEGNVAADLSASGDMLLFGDVVVGTGGAYLRRTDGSPPKRLGDIDALALSPDGRFVLVEDGDPPGSARCFLLVPTGPGQSTRLDNRGIDMVFTEEARSRFFPDGKRIFYEGHEKSHGPRVWVQDIEGGKPHAVTPEGARRPVLVGNGRFVCARAPDFEWYLYPVDEKGEPREVVGLLPGEEPIRSAPDGNLYVRGADELRPGESLMTTRVYRLDPISGRRELWKEIPPLNPRTGGGISTILFSADGKTCVWTHYRYSTELILAEGLK